MRILLLFPMVDGQTGPAIKYAFEKLGHQVDYVDAKRMPLTSFSVASAYKPDLVFCSRTKELADQVVRIKQRFPDAVACVWNVDARIDISEWSDLFPLIKACDYHFVVEYSRIPKWRELNPNTFWLPQGVQNEIYHKPRMISYEDERRYTCDVSFAGSCIGYHGWRKPYISVIESMDVSFKRWGCYGKARIYDEQHNKMVTLSKINFACSGWKGAGWHRYASVRNYKVMGAGGFLLEYYGGVMEELFPSDVIVYYRDTADLERKIRYWLAHDEERKEIAERGYRWVHANATYTDRMREALDYMGMGS